MVVVIYSVNAYHHWCCEFESRSGRGVQNYVIKFVSDLQQVGGFSPGPPVSSINKTDHHDITEILLKVALNTIKQTNIILPFRFWWIHLWYLPCGPQYIVRSSNCLIICRITIGILYQQQTVLSTRKYTWNTNISPAL